MNIKKITKYNSSSFCFYCSVDSTELKSFLIIVIGSLVLSSILVALGAWYKGYFKNVEEPSLKGKVLELEKEDYGK